MFPIHDIPTRLCDRVARRELLRVGGLSAAGLSLPSLLQAVDQPPDGIIADPTFGRAEECDLRLVAGWPASA